MFGIPQVRFRFYIPVVRQAPLKELRVQELAFWSYMEEVMNLFVGHNIIPLHKYMLDEDSPIFQHFYSCVGPLPQAQASTYLKENFMSVKAECQKRGLDVNAVLAPPDASLYEVMPGVQCLTMSQWITLRLLTDLSPLPQEQPRVIDLSQSLGRASPRAPRQGNSCVFVFLS